jgi:hypothetical protein
MVWHHDQYYPQSADEDFVGRIDTNDRGTVMEFAATYDPDSALEWLVVYDTQDNVWTKIEAPARQKWMAQ